MKLDRIPHVAALVQLLIGARAADAADPPPAPEGIHYTVSVSGQHAIAADLEKGGQASATRGSVSVSASRRFVPAFSASLSAGYELTEWKFEAPVAFASTAPWKTIQRPSAGLGLQLALSPRFVLQMNPFAEWSSARGVKASDASTYGATLGAAGIFGPRLTLGGGAKVQRQFFSTKVTAFAIVNAQLSPTLRIANASASGPLGGGGLELRLQPNKTWEFAIGGVYSSTRFRLAPQGQGAGDVGETGGIPILARAAYTTTLGLRADLSAGVLVNGRVERRDPDGRTLAKDDLASAPMVALTLSARR